MKLYDEHGMPTEEARKLREKVQDLLAVVFRDCIEAGCTAMEVSHVIMYATTDAETHCALRGWDERMEEE